MCVKLVMVNCPCCVQGSSMERVCGSFLNSSTCLQKKSLLWPPTATWNMSGMTLKPLKHLFPSTALLLPSSPYYKWGMCFHFCICAFLGFSPGNDVFFSSFTLRHFHCLVYKDVRISFFTLSPTHGSQSASPCSHEFSAAVVLTI